MATCLSDSIETCRCAETARTGLKFGRRGRVCVLERRRETEMLATGASACLSLSARLVAGVCLLDNNDDGSGAKGLTAHLI